MIFLPTLASTPPFTVTTSIPNTAVSFSADELIMLRALARGQSIADLSLWLGITARKAKSLRGRVFAKLGVHDRMQLNRVGKKMGLLPFEPHHPNHQRYGGC